MASIHSIRARVLVCLAALALLAPAPHAAAQSQDAPTASPSTFTIFLRGVRVGTEQVGVERSPSGWTITGNGRIGAPLDVVTRQLRMRYDAEWHPVELTLEAAVRGQPSALRTTFSGATAANSITTAGSTTEKNDAIEERSVVLPNPAFAPYEALAARLQAAPQGSTIPVYVAPQGTMSATVGGSETERIQTASRLVDAVRTRVTLGRPGVPPLEVDVWRDAASARLLRVSVPAQGLEVVREDIGSVSARRVIVTRAGDEQLRINANGFSLAATLSKPQASGAQRFPAVVLVGGAGPTDRDEFVYGVPIFGQLADSLADAGFLVLRYDKRGVGQSGGRPEAATLADYAEDLRAVVRHVTDRRDVDRNRVAVVGHGEGGSIAMLAAAREGRIRALVLIAAIGETGAEFNMKQVTRALERSGRSDSEREETLALQKKIQQAVLTGKGWEEIPEHLRQQADVPWFQSFLAFDPARLMRDIDQPVLVIQGALDKQVDPANADKLAALAEARRRQVPSDAVIIPGINHLLVPATTGEIDEYGSLPEKTVSPEVGRTIAEWLTRVSAKS